MIACSDSSSSGTPGPDGGVGGDAGAETCTGEGSVEVRISGLPAGATARVTVTGGGSTTDVDATRTLTLPAGEYVVEALDVATADPIVRTVHRGTVSAPSVSACSESPSSIEVTYARLPSSGKVWMSNRNGSASVLGFASAALPATATQPATVAAKTQGGGGIAFDNEGNLWAIGGTTVDPTLVRYPAASLGESGDKTPDRKINIANSGCSPLAQALAFDKVGNLWASLLCEKKVVRISNAELAADGDVTPGVAIGGLTAPKGIAFDADGNLFVADGTIKRFDAARLAASSDAAPEAELTIANADAEDLAFDANGDLWAVGGSDVNLTRLAKADVAAAGASTPTPGVQISVGVAALPHGIAFDEGGGLWIATSLGKFARLAPAQLGIPTTFADPTTPERIITSDDVGSGGSVVLFPAPAGLPLYSAVQ